MSRNCLSRRLMITAVVVSYGAICSATSAATLFEETFDTDVANTAAFTAQYPGFTVSGAKPVTVVGGVATIVGNAVTDVTTLTVPGYSEEIIISVDIGALNSNGAYNVGLVIGNNSIAFHPGFTNVPGAFRVNGPGGFGNSDMGFVPANGVLHHLEVHQFPDGKFDVTLIDGDNPANVYTATWTNPGAVGGLIGLRHDGPLGGGPRDGLYDNFRITDTAVIPEPSTLVLAALGLLGLILGARRRR